jgi:hypothetical protein
MDTYSMDELPYLDAFHPPTPADPEGQLYKEWHHFVFLDSDNKLFGLLNFSLIGGPYSRGGAIASITALFSRNDRRWSGNIESHTSDFFRFSPLNPGVQIDRSVLLYDGGEYRLSGQLRSQSIFFDLHFEVVSPPMLATFSPFATGYSRWLVVPRLIVRGVVSLDGSRINLTSAVGYHDHNWGRFRWGDPFGWDGGLFLEPRDGPNDPLSILVIRYLHRGRHDLVDSVMYLASDTIPFTTILGTDVRVDVERTSGSAVRKFPGTANIMFPELHRPVSSRMVAVGRTPERAVSIDFRPQDVCQLVCVDTTGSGITVLDEMFGEAVLERKTPRGSERTRVMGYMESARPL